MRNQEFHKGVDGLKSLGTPVLDDDIFLFGRSPRTIRKIEMDCLYSTLE